jgi:hypothetical protein
MQKRARFVRITNAGFKESGSHDVKEVWLLLWYNLIGGFDKWERLMLLLVCSMGMKVKEN